MTKMYLGYQDGKIKAYFSELSNVYIDDYEKIEETEDEYILSLDNTEFIKKTTKVNLMIQISNIEIANNSLKEELTDIDNRCVRPLRAILAGTDTEEDKEMLKNLETEAQLVRTQIQENEEEIARLTIEIDKFQEAD